MKKKLIAMMLAFVMVFSLSLPAYAAEGDTETKWTNPTNTPNDRNKEDVYGDPDNQNLGVGYGESDITIKVIEDDKPCDHKYEYTRDPGTGVYTHSAVCSVCGMTCVVKQACIDIDDDLKCDLCEGALVCGGQAYKYRDNGDGTHTKLCTSGGHDEHDIASESHHVDENGTTCKDCGATITCEHPEEQKTIKSNGKNASDVYTHSIICGKCNAVLDTENCYDSEDDGNLQCDKVLNGTQCSNQLDCKHSDSGWLEENEPQWEYDPENPGHHTANCPNTDCGKTLTGECLDSDHDCACDLCGNVTHTYKWVPNKDNKTHSYCCSVCSDDSELPEGESSKGPEAHADTSTPKDGLCNKCGFMMSKVGQPVVVAQVPAEIPIVATTSGFVTIPTNLRIKNESESALVVDGVGYQVTGWYPLDTSADFAETELPAPPEGYAPWEGFIGINLRGTCITTANPVFNQGDWIIQAGAELPLNLAVKISPQDEEKPTATKIGSIRFSLAWYNGTSSSVATLGAEQQDLFNKGLGDTVYTVTVRDAEEIHYTVVGDIKEFKTDRFGYILQLPDVIAHEGYAFTGWIADSGTVLTDNFRIARNIFITPLVKKVSAGTITFSNEGLPDSAVIEYTTMETGTDGRVYHLPTVTGLPVDCRFLYWESDSGYRIDIGSPFDGDKTLYAVTEYNALDADRLYDATNWSQFTGAITVKAADSNASVEDGVDVSAFQDRSIVIVFDSGNATIQGPGMRLPANMTWMFSDMPSMTAITFDSGLNWSDVTIMEGMFSGDSALKTITWNTPDLSNVTSMRALFEGCTAINIASSVTAIGAANTSKVRDMSYMFAECDSINSFTNLKSFEVDSLQYVEGMFMGCDGKSTTGMYLAFDFTSWDKAKLTNMAQMFKDVKNLGPVDLSMIDTSNVTTMYEMFSGSTPAQPNVKNWDVSKVESFSGMFYGNQYTAAELDLTGWKLNLDAKPYVTQMFGAFTRNIVGLSAGDREYIINNNGGLQS